VVGLRFRNNEFHLSRCPVKMGVHIRAECKREIRRVEIPRRI
jgi:hypothetical protein